MSTWVFGAERWDNLIYYALGGHKDAIVACFFEASSLDVRPHHSPSPGDTGAVGARQALAAPAHVLVPTAWVGVGWGLGNPLGSPVFLCSCTRSARTAPCACGSVTPFLRACG